jgi:hypothetical protein
MTSLLVLDLLSKSRTKRMLGCFAIGIDLLGSMLGYLAYAQADLEQEDVKHPTTDNFKGCHSIFKYIPSFVCCLLCVPCHFVYRNASFP